MSAWERMPGPRWGEPEQPKNDEWSYPQSSYGTSYERYGEATYAGRATDQPHDTPNGIVAGTALSAGGWTDGGFGHSSADGEGPGRATDPTYQPTQVFQSDTFRRTHPETSFETQYPTSAYDHAGGYPPAGDPEPREDAPWYVDEPGYHVQPPDTGFPPADTQDETQLLGHSPVEDLRQPDAPPPDPSGQDHGRAGRNLPAAIGVGVFLAGVLLASLYIYPAAFVGLAAVAIVLAIWELGHALAGGGIRIPVVPLLVGAVAMLVGTYAGGPQTQIITLGLTALAVLVWRMPEGPEGYLRDATAGVFSAVYVPFLASFAVMLLDAPDGNHRVTSFILMTALSDTGGYVAGVLFGRHPLAPRISPKKSWEGLVGSILFATGGGAVAVLFLLDGPAWKGAIIGLAVAFTATLGDLVESLVKRDLGVKDMGKLLPGHGGVMDRLDSLLVTAPVTWLLFTLLLPSV